VGSISAAAAMCVSSAILFFATGSSWFLVPAGLSMLIVQNLARMRRRGMVNLEDRRSSQ
jgi:hypothetical protein